MSTRKWRAQRAGGVQELLDMMKSDTREHADSNKTVFAFLVVWALFALAWLAVWGVVIWGIVKLVGWVVAQ